ncbi:MAG TPA: hypothetical protein VIK53_14310 [Verrucomicrobiae bacterium]
MSNPLNTPVWKEAKISTLSLVLDVQNPRIEVKETATQDEVRHALCATEKVGELAKGIANTNGLMAGERIIVVEEEGKYIVLEGNRRACACQMLLDAKLIPSALKSTIPAIPAQVTSAISELAADVAPSRQAAEIIITRRHTEPGIEQWSVLAKQRRILRLLKSGVPLKKISEDFGMSPSKLTKLLKEISIIEDTKQLACWNDEERKVLENPELKPNAYTRFFTLKGVKDTLGIAFDDQGKISSSLPSPAFKKALESLARRFLIPNSKDETEFNTRATPEEVFTDIAANDKPLGKKLGYSGKTSKAKRRSTVGKFFESLQCPVSDGQLRVITKEISGIDYHNFPTAATFLLRALIERTLNYAIGHANLQHQLKKEWHATGKNHPEPGLDFIVTFCINHKSEVFSGRVDSALQHWQRTKDLHDLIIHGKWAKAHPTTLEQAACVTRDLVEKVFSGEALKQ